MSHYNAYPTPTGYNAQPGKVSREIRDGLTKHAENYSPPTVHWDETTFRRYTNPDDGSLTDSGVIAYAAAYHKGKTPIPPKVMRYGTWYDGNGNLTPNAEPSDQEDEQLVPHAAGQVSHNTESSSDKGKYNFWENSASTHTSYVRPQPVPYPHNRRLTDEQRLARLGKQRALEHAGRQIAEEALTMYARGWAVDPETNTWVMTREPSAQQVGVITAYREAVADIAASWKAVRLNQGKRTLKVLHGALPEALHVLSARALASSSAILRTAADTAREYMVVHVGGAVAAGAGYLTDRGEFRRSLNPAREAWNIAVKTGDFSRFIQNIGGAAINGIVAHLGGTTERVMAHWNDGHLQRADLIRHTRRAFGEEARTFEARTRYGRAVIGYAGERALAAFTGFNPDGVAIPRVLLGDTRRSEPKPPLEEAPDWMQPLLSNLENAGATWRERQKDYIRDEAERVAAKHAEQPPRQNPDVSSLVGKAAAEAVAALSTATSENPTAQDDAGAQTTTMPVEATDEDNARITNDMPLVSGKAHAQTLEAFDAMLQNMSDPSRPYAAEPAPQVVPPRTSADTQPLPRIDSSITIAAQLASLANLLDTMPVALPQAGSSREQPSPEASAYARDVMTDIRRGAAGPRGVDALNVVNDMRGTELPETVIARAVARAGVMNNQVPPEEAAAIIGLQLYKMVRDDPTMQALERQDQPYGTSGHQPLSISDTHTRPSIVAAARTAPEWPTGIVGFSPRPTITWHEPPRADGGSGTARPGAYVRRQTPGTQRPRTLAAMFPRGRA